MTAANYDDNSAEAFWQQADYHFPPHGYSHGIRGSNHTKALRHLYDVIESNVRSLRALGVAADSYGSLLSSVLMNKLPNELRLIISSKVGDGEWNLEALLKELVEEIEARERTMACATHTPNPQARQSSKEPATAAALFSNSSQPHCCFCSQQHFSDKCQVVRGAEVWKQWSFLRLPNKRTPQQTLSVKDVLL